MVGLYVSSRRSILKVSEGFRAAEVLADFVNLNPADSAAVAYFRNNYPDFAPSEWWDYQFEDAEIIARVHPLPGSNLNPADYGARINFPLESIWQDAQDEIWRAWSHQFQFESVLELTQLLKQVFVAPTEMVFSMSHLSLSDGELYELSTPKAYTFHKAVLYLHQHPNQAKICEECKKCFVSVHGKRTLCLFPDARGETCGQKRINRDKLKWWHERGNKQRQAKSKRKSTRKKSNRGAHNNA